MGKLPIIDLEKGSEMLAPIKSSVVLLGYIPLESEKPTLFALDILLCCRGTDP